jgi:hypothetical protein
LIVIGYRVPHTCRGTLRDLTKFDAGNFGVPLTVASELEPQLRMLLEVTYEAIVDGGEYIMINFSSISRHFVSECMFNTVSLDSALKCTGHFLPYSLH